MPLCWPRFSSRQARLFHQVPINSFSPYPLPKFKATSTLVCSTSQYQNLYVSWVCHSQLPPTGWLKTRKVYPFRVLEATSQGIFRPVLSLSEGSREEFFFASSSFRGCWQSLVWNSIIPILPRSPESPLPCVSSTSLSQTNPLIKTNRWIGAHPNPVRPHLNSVTSAKTSFSNKVTFVDARGQDTTNISFWGTQSNPLWW